MNRQMIPAEDCVEALIQAGGNTYLAAERLFGPDPHGVSHLVATIAGDPLAQESLNAQLRTMATLKAYDALTQAQNLLPTIMGDLEPADFTKFYTNLLKNVTDLATVQTPIDPTDAMARLLQVLPPEARRAFLTLVGSRAPAHALPESDAVGSQEFVIDGGSADPSLTNDFQPTSATGSEADAA